MRRRCRARSPWLQGRQRKRSRSPLLAVTVPTVVTITATYRGVVKTATLTVNPAAAALLGVSVNPTAVTGNAGSTGTVTLTSAAPAGGAVVTLSEQQRRCGDGAGLGHRGCRGDNENVPGHHHGGTVPTAVTITATYSGVVKTATLTVNPAAAALLGVSVNPTAVTGNAGSTGTVTLASAAPAGGAVVTLRSSNGDAATVPGTVTVAAGATTKTFPVTTMGGDGPDGRDHHGHIQRRGQDRDADGESGGGSSARRKRQSNGSDG